MDNLDQQEKEDKVDQQEKQGDQQKETNEDDQHLVYDETLRKFDDMDIGKGRERSTMSNETILAQDEVVKSKKKKLPVRSSRKTQGRNDVAPIIVSSPLSSEESNMLHLTFQISNGSIVVIEKGKGRCTTRGNIAKLRLSSGIEMEFISMRSHLMVDVGEELVKKILVDQASTATLNLFGIWMENTLPNDILEQVLFVDGMWSCMSPKVCGPFMQRFFSNFDVSKATLIFLPIILRNHWSLFAFCHNKHKKSLGFKGRNSFLLYFDSMGLIDPKECEEVLHSVFACLAHYVADWSVKHALLNPKEELDLKIVEVPRQINSSDCGFYVMACARYLIGGVLQDKKDKKWLTKNWFNFEDVCSLRMDLHTWCMQCLSQL